MTETGAQDGQLLHPPLLSSLLVSLLHHLCPPPVPAPPCSSLLRPLWGGLCGVLVGWVAQRVPRRGVVAGLVALCLLVAEGQ